MSSNKAVIGTTPAIKILKPRDEILNPPGAYFLVKIHAAQAAYAGSIWRKVRQLVITSHVTLGSGQEKIRAIQRVHPVQHGTQQLGLATNLIDLTPATVDRVSLSIEFRLDRQNRLALLGNLINSDAFVSVVSLAPGAVAAAKAMSGITQKILTTFLDDDDNKPILEFRCDFNIPVGEPEHAYYVIFGSKDFDHPLPRPLPEFPDLQVQGSELMLKGRPVTDLSYIVLDVHNLSSRGKQLGRGESWHKKLSDADEKARGITYNPFATQKDRDDTSKQCFNLLSEASVLLRDDPLYLHSEAVEIIRDAFKKVDEKIYPKEKIQLGAPSRLSPEVKSLLGVDSEKELINAVQAYSAKIKSSLPMLVELGLLSLL